MEPLVGEDGLEQGKALLESILIEKTGRGGKKKLDALKMEHLFANR